MCIPIYCYQADGSTEWLREDKLIRYMVVCWSLYLVLQLVDEHKTNYYLESLVSHGLWHSVGERPIHQTYIMTPSIHDRLLDYLGVFFVLINNWNVMGWYQNEKWKAGKISRKFEWVYVIIKLDRCRMTSIIFMRNFIDNWDPALPRQLIFSSITFHNFKYA